MKLFGGQSSEQADSSASPYKPGRGRTDYTDQLNRDDDDDNEYSASPQQRMTVKKRISSLVRGPIQGHQARRKGSPKKTFKKAKLDCTEEEIEYNWTQFKQQLDDIYQNENQPKYSGHDPLDLIDLYLKPKIDNIKQILLEEDMQ